MTVELKPGVRYRMPVVFGPAPGPRQKADGTPWTEEESGVMNSRWITVRYRTDRTKLASILPPGFALRGEPIVSVSLSFFNNLYWLAGRGYGIVMVEFPVTYTGKHERFEGTFCPVLWEGRPDAIITGREELGFPKLFADIPLLQVNADQSAVSGEASWFDHKFFELEAHDLVEAEPVRGFPGGGGPQMFYKYLPRTGPGGQAGKDVGYVTTSAPPPGAGGEISSIDFKKFNFKRWTGKGSVKWHKATFEQLPTTFHVVNGIANLDVLEVVSTDMLVFSGPGVAVSAGSMRAVEPAED
jgi:hypothetical protein